MEIKKKITQQNLRPTIPSKSNPFFSRMIQQCWNSFPHKRPSSRSVFYYLNNLYKQMKENLSNDDNIDLINQWNFCYNSDYSFISDKGYLKNSVYHLNKREYNAFKKIKTTKIKLNKN